MEPLTEIERKLIDLIEAHREHRCNGDGWNWVTWQQVGGVEIGLDGNHLHSRKTGKEITPALLKAKYVDLYLHMYGKIEEASDNFERVALAIFPEALA